MTEEEAGDIALNMESYGDDYLDGEIRRLLEFLSVDIANKDTIGMDSVASSMEVSVDAWLGRSNSRLHALSIETIQMMIKVLDSYDDKFNTPDRGLGYGWAAHRLAGYIESRTRSGSVP